jgi:hypothetical protein
LFELLCGFFGAGGARFIAGWIAGRKGSIRKRWFAGGRPFLWRAVTGTVSTGLLE